MIPPAGRSNAVWQKSKAELPTCPFRLHKGMSGSHFFCIIAGSRSRRPCTVVGNCCGGTHACLENPKSSEAGSQVLIFNRWPKIGKYAFPSCQTALLPPCRWYEGRPSVMRSMKLRSVTVVRLVRLGLDRMKASIILFCIIDTGGGLHKRTKFDNPEVCERPHIERRLKM